MKTFFFIITLFTYSKLILAQLNEAEHVDINHSPTQNQVEENLDPMPVFNLENVLALSQEKIITFPNETCFVVDETIKVISNGIESLKKNFINPKILFSLFRLKKLAIENYNGEGCKFTAAEYFIKLSKIEDSILSNQVSSKQIKLSDLKKSHAAQFLKADMKNSFTGETDKLESGDIVLSTTTNTGYNFQRVLTPQDNIFTHASLVYISPEDSKTFLISIDLKKGLVIEDFHALLKANEFYRYSVLRPKDKEIASKAAKNSFQYAKNMTQTEARNYFDIKFDLNDSKKEYCTEFIFRQFNQVKPGFFEKESFTLVNFLSDSLPEFELGKKQMSFIFPINFLNSKNLYYIGEYKVRKFIKYDHFRYIRAQIAYKYPVQKLIAGMGIKDKLMNLIWQYRDNQIVLKILDFIGKAPVYASFSKYLTYYAKIKTDNASYICSLSGSKASNSNERDLSKLNEFNDESNKKFAKCFDDQISK